MSDAHLKKIFRYYLSKYLQVIIDVQFLELVTKQVTVL